MVIRPAAATDLPAMIALAGRAATAAQWTAADYEALFKPGVVPRHSLVLEEAGVVHAFIVAKQVGQSWEIENIVTAAEARRRGFATRLLAEMMSIAYDCRRADYYSSPVEDAIIFRYFFPKKFLEIVEAK